VGYVILTVVGLGLTWVTDVFQIISYASRAFAVYYALQAAIAALAAQRQGARGRAIWFAALALLAFAVAVFGQAVEV
jgi:hypothetical protein